VSDHLSLSFLADNSQPLSLTAFHLLPHPPAQRKNILSAKINVLPHLGKTSLKYSIYDPLSASMNTRCSFVGTQYLTHYPYANYSVAEERLKKPGLLRRRFP
jgi:hypothetical protein